MTAPLSIGWCGPVDPDTTAGRLAAHVPAALARAGHRVVILHDAGGQPPVGVPAGGRLGTAEASFLLQRCDVAVHCLGDVLGSFAAGLATLRSVPGLLLLPDGLGLHGALAAADAARPGGLAEHVRALAGFRGTEAAERTAARLAVSRAADPQVPRLEPPYVEPLLEPALAVLTATEADRAVVESLGAPLTGVLDPALPDGPDAAAAFLVDVARTAVAAAPLLRVVASTSRLAAEIGVPGDQRLVGTLQDHVAELFAGWQGPEGPAELAPTA